MFVLDCPKPNTFTNYMLKQPKSQILSISP